MKVHALRLMNSNDQEGYAFTEPSVQTVPIAATTRVVVVVYVKWGRGRAQGSTGPRLYTTISVQVPSPLEFERVLSYCRNT